MSDEKYFIGEYADYLICDPDGLSNNGVPVMEPPEAAFAMLRYLTEMLDHLTGADPETMKQTNRPSRERKP